jgi:hypothetical protein
MHVSIQQSERHESEHLVWKYSLSLVCGYLNVDGTVAHYSLISLVNADLSYDINADIEH